MAIKVKNLNGTSDSEVPAGYSSWLEYWEKKTGNKANQCGCCMAKASVGAHVKKCDSVDNNWYIVPLCQRCNNRPPSQEITAYKDLYPANEN